MACTTRCGAPRPTARAAPAALGASRAGLSLPGARPHTPARPSLLPRFTVGRPRLTVAAASSDDKDGDVPEEISQVVFKRRLEMQYLKEKVDDAKKDAQDCDANEEAADCAVEWDTVEELQSALDKKSGKMSLDLDSGELPPPPERTREEELEWRRKQVELNTGFDPNALPKPTGSLKAAAELEKAMRQRRPRKRRGDGGGKGKDKAEADEGEEDGGEGGAE